jgi:hypothetical protein
MSADVFVYLDMVQFSKNGLQNRNQIKGPAGELWLTVPVKQKLGQRLSEIEIADPAATTRHWKTLQANYAQAPGFRKWHDELKSLLDQQYHSLVDLAIVSTEWMLEKLAVGTKRLRASDLTAIGGESSKLVASICKELNANVYLTGTGALAYLDQRDFTTFGCHISVQKWKTLLYEQVNSSLGFIPDLSTLDLLLNCPNEAASMIRSAGNWEPLPNS